MFTLLCYLIGVFRLWFVVFGVFRFPIGLCCLVFFVCVCVVLFLFVVLCLLFVVVRLLSADCCVLLAACKWPSVV